MVAVARAMSRARTASDRQRRRASSRSQVTVISTVRSLAVRAVTAPCPVTAPWPVMAPHAVHGYE